MHRAQLISPLLAAAVALMGPLEASAEDASPFLAPKDEAVIVFIQNLRGDERTEFIIFGPERICIAKVIGREAEVVPISPGRHTLYATSFNNHRLEVEVEAGRTYFIRLYSVEKFATIVSHADVVQRGTDAYRNLKTWLRGARITHARDDECRGNPPEKRENRTQKRINDANADWKHENDAFRARHLMLKSDGLTPSELARL